MTATRRARRTTPWAVVVVAVLGAFASTARAADLAHSGFTPITPEAQVARMGRGINVLGYDPFWTGGPARFHEKHFTAIRQAGFSTIRVNLAAFRHMDADDRLDPAWLKKLDWVVHAALGAGLNVIVDEHDFNACAKDYDACRRRLTAFWRQVAPRYADAPNTVLFELLNEPNGVLTADRWNSLLAEELAVVRQTNPARSVVIGPAHWNSRSDLKDLILPEADRNLVVTVHYYEPMTFTHQGAAWVDSTKALSGVSWGAPADLAKVDADFDGVQAWARAHGRPILLGEFGAYDKGALPDRVRYDSTVARAAEARGWAWAYWQFDSDFVAWDMKQDAWVAPILKALIPPARP
jgi:endoglucanase